MNKPSHVAIIMDGNGRWAQTQGLKRTKGHEVGAEVIRTISTYCSLHKDIDYLTLYAFSTENWKRPKLEVEFLMKLLEKYLDNEKPTYLKNNTRFKAIGDLTRFSSRLQKKIKDLEDATAHCTSLVQSLALNYGGRDEIVRSVHKLQEENLEVTEESLTQHLDLETEIDVFLRTGGDYRISNYLLWQASYAELFFIDTLWPDFDEVKLEEVLAQFATRQRRFGGI